MTAAFHIQCKIISTESSLCVCSHGSGSACLTVEQYALVMSSLLLIRCLVKNEESRL